MYKMSKLEPWTNLSHNILLCIIYVCWISLRSSIVCTLGKNWHGPYAGDIFLTVPWRTGIWNFLPCGPSCRTRSRREWLRTRGCQIHQPTILSVAAIGDFGNSGFPCARRASMRSAQPAGSWKRACTTRLFRFGSEETLHASWDSTAKTSIWIDSCALRFASTTGGHHRHPHGTNIKDALKLSQISLPEYDWCHCWTCCA